MMSLSRKSDYGLIILSYISQKKEKVALSELVEKTGLPHRFVARIASELALNHFLTSREGREGGYVVGPELKTATLFDYLTLFEKHVNLAACAEKGYICEYEHCCTHKSKFLREVNNVYIKQLKSQKLKKLL